MGKSPTLIDDGLPVGVVHVDFQAFGIEQCVDNLCDDLGKGVVSEITEAISVPHRLFRKAVQQGRRERSGES